MLIWICAFHCEAKPVIDRLRLKKSHAETPFDLYEGERDLCIVSGPGKLAAAAACAWQGARRPVESRSAWINLGIAGAAGADIGAAFRLDQIIDGDSGQRFYPVPTARSELPSAACISLARAEAGYHPQHLHDMEASGFFFAATRFSSAELVQAIKIVSDNTGRSVARDRAQVSELIATRMPAIEAEADRLRALAAEIEGLQTEPKTLPAIFARHRFSQTQQVRLRRLLRYLELRGIEATAVDSAIATCRAGRATIAELERLCRQDSESL